VGMNEELGGLEVVWGDVDVGEGVWVKVLEKGLGGEEWVVEGVEEEMVVGGVNRDNDGLVDFVVGPEEDTGALFQIPQGTSA
ncbi:hypothetical protein, partial [Neisseria sicca]|uniref:hypothetical protein n=1 Tax=Neisseria sicca TaxID=490 RepID=UPI001C99462A